MLKRVLGYMLHYYKYLFILVIGCILVSAVCTVVGATFPQTLVDDYIDPMLPAAPGTSAAWPRTSSSWCASWGWASSPPSPITASWST